MYIDMCVHRHTHKNTDMSTLPAEIPAELCCTHRCAHTLRGICGYADAFICSQPHKVLHMSK